MSENQTIPASVEPAEPQPAPGDPAQPSRTATYIHYGVTAFIGLILGAMVFRQYPSVREVTVALGSVAGVCLAAVPLARRR